MRELKSTYDTWHAAIASASESDRIQPWHENALAFIPDLNHLEVLEVGCGRGDFAIFLSRKFLQSKITAVDFSDSAVATALSRSTDAPRPPVFQVEDAQSMSFASASFDFVLSCECMEHVPDPSRMAKEIARVLKPGGRFVITTENYANGLLLAWIVAWLRRQPFDSGTGVQPHENFFLFWRVRRLLERAGLQVETMTSSHFQWLLLPRVAPDKLRTDRFRTPLLNRAFRPFGRHFTFVGSRV